MIRVKEAIVVEGRYDKHKLSSLVDGLILETDGFGIFRDGEKREYLRRLAKERGLIILTDSDGAGFLIRSKLSSWLPPDRIKHAYIPDLFGKERRKAAPGKEGKLGVEGMELSVLQDALERAGATFEDDPGKTRTAGDKLTKADLYDFGFSGATDSARRRQALLKKLNLPARLSSNGLVQALNSFYSREEALNILKEAADA